MTKFEQKQVEISVSDVAKIAAERKENGWHFIQMLALRTQSANDLVYTYRKDGIMEDLIVRNVTENDKIPSITNSYIAAFVFENEAHDLFGLNVEGIAIDFKGKFYNVAVDKPMSIISPEVAERLEKQAKVDAAKAAKAAKDAASKPEKTVAAPVAPNPAAPSANVEPAAKPEAEPSAPKPAVNPINTEGKGE